MTRVALLDGPLPVSYPALCAQKRFIKADGATAACAHALAMATTILRHAPDVEFINAIVFPGRLATSVSCLCDALEWIAQDPPEIVLCSFGLARSSLELEMRISALQAAGTLFVASSPVHREKIYPAAYADVLSVQGDARCKPSELSQLGLPGARYGACVIAPEAPGVQGASVAAAHVGGVLAASWRGRPDTTLQAFGRRIRYRGCDNHAAPAH
ncbi:hypothetical protein [Breoghania sp.]|uniref:hypothetical protein n=1 Tax=Breoghania sp. TaxID=2065378 RepID=UPI002AA86FDA|nr:hypothetical protein [Breoghania sp.]